MAGAGLLSDGFRDETDGSWCCAKDDSDVAATSQRHSDPLLTDHTMDRTMETRDRAPTFECPGARLRALHPTAVRPDLSCVAGLGP